MMVESSSAAETQILVVEDDPFVRQILEMYLHNEGYQVTLARDGNEMRKALAERRPHLVLMDVRLPGEDGFTLTRFLRSQYDVGIIILTTRHETVDRVVGLECGADDYVTKPFEERELIARIRSVLRRSGNLAHAAGAQPETNAAPTMQGQRVVFHGCTLDEDICLLRTRDGVTIELTANECRLLAHLVRNRSRVQSREDLMTAVLQRHWEPLDRSIDVLITRLRHKIEADPKRPAIIRTVRGSGYVVMPDAAISDSAA